jgi:arylsulfatase A-like enzyme
MGGRLFGAARGLGLGLLAGALWAALETAGGWAAGGSVSSALLLDVLGLDLAVGGGIGLLAGVAMPAAGAGTLALVLAAAYGFLRVYSPPGMGAETLFVAAATAVVLLGRRLLGPDDARGVLGFAHVTLLAAGVLLAADLALDESHGTALRGMRLPLLMAALPLLAVAADRVVAFALRGRALRLVVEATVAAVAVLALGSPLHTAPLDETTVTAVPPPAGTPDVVLVTLDTTRADHLSLYGYPRETSPNLSRFADDALVFTQARTAAGWTLPGHASLFTGTYPTRHGAHLAGGFLAGQSIDGRRNVAYPLAADKTTLAEVLRDRGYSTAGFAANFSYLYRDFGVAQGFQHYEDQPGLLLRLKPPVVRFAQKFRPGFCLKPYRTAHEINAAALDWLDHAPKGRPAFVFLNYMEAHQPWLAPAPYDKWVWALPQAGRLVTENLYTHEVKNFSAEETEFITANYDGQVAAMDAALGELIAALRARGRYENTLIVVTADHGELLGDHGQVGHMGRMLYEGLLHVPMVVKLPGADHPRGRRDESVQIVDVAPTAMTVAGAPIPPEVQGQQLLHVDHPSFAEEDINPFLVAQYGPFYDRAVRVVYDGPWKLITTSRGEKMLFDVAKDPGETTDLATAEPERVQRLTQRLETELGTMVATAESAKQVN